jgi:hypothetical protein
MRTSRRIVCRVPTVSRRLFPRQQEVLDVDRHRHAGHESSHSGSDLGTDLGDAGRITADDPDHALLRGQPHAGHPSPRQVGGVLAERSGV